ncbi:MAG: NAD-dependent epimerase/dehydratase family protein [Thermodesulfovibrionales bacterium]|nr:NAD-dependent epimerase/dehydratase family protein [Thermodesulfovibrionales bacterium]
MIVEEREKLIACVTGASGMVGRRIMHRLLQQGYTVRALTRRKDLALSGVDMRYGDIRDESALKSFLNRANLLFHCAAELKDESRMWDVNVVGTEILLHLIPWAGITYFCHLSSAGVVGKTDMPIVDETSPCNPRNMYERTKWEAEKRVAKGVKGCRVVVLRPTNVIDERQSGALGLPMRSGWADYLKIFLKGGENAHVVHADDVAAAALYFIAHASTETPQCFFISYDHEPINTFAGIWKLYKNFERVGSFDESGPRVVHLPAAFPKILRIVMRGASNRGDIVYSSEKLLSHGFVFPLGLKGAIRQVIEERER